MLITYTLGIASLTGKSGMAPRVLSFAENVSRPSNYLRQTTCYISSSTVNSPSSQRLNLMSKWYRSKR